MTLVDRGPEQWHDLSAGTDALASEHVQVDIDPTFPEVTKLVLQQPGFLTYTFDPRQGVATPPVVWSPSVPLIVTATVDHPERVSGASIRIGDTELNAVANGDGTYTATLAQGVAPQGGIYVDLTPSPAPPQVQQWTHAQLEASLPVGAEGFEQLPLAPDQPQSGAATASGNVAIPELGPDARLQASVTWQPGLRYTPTADDLAFQQATGLPVYGLTVSPTVGADSVSGEITLYIPSSVTSNVASSRRSASDTTIDVGKVVIDTGCAACGAVDGIVGALGAGDKYKRLDDLLDLADQECNSAKAGLFHDRILNLRNAAVFDDSSTAALAALGLIAAPETFGASLVFTSSPSMRARRSTTA